MKYVCPFSDANRKVFHLDAKETLLRVPLSKKHP
jgi:hypothetical protein